MSKGNDLIDRTNELVAALRERAGYAREEGGGTAIGDARYFETAAATIASLSEALAEAEKKEEDAAIGRSFMTSFEQIVNGDGPYQGYAPAEDPAELVLDLYEDLLVAQDAGWLPIESARTDGTAMIVAAPVGQGRDPIVGEAYCNTTRGGWWWANTSDAHHAVEPIDPPPTHWRPLPPPPRDLSQGGQQ